MFDNSIKFKYPWRDYQTRVIDQAQRLIDDGHIHIVAAPGSGKTVLGLELMRKINHPTIILAPTIAIRNQWAERFTSLFMECQELPEWISLNINCPKKITIATYQGLYSAMAGKQYKDKNETDLNEESTENETVIESPDEEQSENNVIFIPISEKEKSGTADPSKPNKNAKAAAYLNKLNELKIRTIIVDEAHHLRNDWWRSLNELKSGLDTPVVIALTATPPYDSEPSEWRKYQSFCGTIDMEVSVPELVGKGDLCPHQDYVHFSTLDESEKFSALSIQKKANEYFESLVSDQEFIQALLQHPVFTNEDSLEEMVFENPTYFTAMGAFLLSADQADKAKPLLKLISGRNFSLMPRFNKSHAEILLSTALYKDKFLTSKPYDVLIKRLRDKGTKAGVIESRQICLVNIKSLTGLLRNSISKLESIRRIVKFEYEVYGPKLRCVILTDFIRKEFLPPYSGMFSKIGVIPIFETLRATLGSYGSSKLGVLSGVMVILPVCVQKQFSANMKQIAESIGTATPKVSYTEYSGDKNFVICNVSDQTRQFVVRAVTKLFEDGDIEILVGTKSLLGEGWDAPAINSLVLASVVGSFMLSNQMRGRAIRVDKNRPDKVANIWHLATVLPEGFDNIDKNHNTTNDLGSEFHLLERRFDTFVGIHANEDKIESGLNRALYLNSAPYKIDSIGMIIDQANQDSIAMAKNKNQVRDRWKKSLTSNQVAQLIHTVRVDKPKLPRQFIFGQTLKAAMLTVFFYWVTFLQMLPSIHNRRSYDPALELKLIFTLGCLATLIAGIRALWLIYLGIRHFSPESSMEQVGQALCITMCKAGLLKTPEPLLKIIAEKSSDGTVTCGLTGGTTFENDLFLDCLEELLAPIDNPRYLLQTGSKYRFLPIGINYFSIPSLVAQHKKNVLIFLAAWKKRVGNCRGIYTRTVQGRRSLLEARRESLSSHLSESKRKSVWQ